MSRRERRVSRIVRRYLFGDMTCREGGCNHDGTCVVAMPAIQFDYRRADEGGVGQFETWVERVFCERCARERIEHETAALKPRRRRKAVP